MKLISSLILLQMLTCQAQVLFTSGANKNLQLFEQRANGAVQINTGFSTHEGLAVSRDGRFATFAEADQNNMGGTIIPSTDLIELDRATGLTRKLIDHQSTIGGFFDVVSSGMSRNNEFVAVGTELFLRFGLQADSSGRILTVINRATGLQVSDVTAIRNGAVPDGLNLEFSGISWSPRADSFITPFYIPVVSQRGLPGNLPAIVRFDRNASGEWVPAQTLSTPLSLDAQLPPSSVAQAYPAYSPSGQGIAYFSILYDGTQGNRAQASVITADATGANARNLFTFNPGFLPNGLSWTPDGSQLIVSVAPQTQIGGVGYLPSKILAQSVIRAISTNDGAISQLPGIDGGAAAGLAVNPPALQDLSSITPTLSRSSNGTFLLKASGLDPSQTFRLESSTSLNSFPNFSQFTGSEFANGIPIETSETKKFFRIRSL